MTPPEAVETNASLVTEVKPVNAARHVEKEDNVDTTVSEVESKETNGEKQVALKAEKAPDGTAESVEDGGNKDTEPDAKDEEVNNDIEEPLVTDGRESSDAAEGEMPEKTEKGKETANKEVNGDDHESLNKEKTGETEPEANGEVENVDTKEHLETGTKKSEQVEEKAESIPENERKEMNGDPRASITPKEDEKIHVEEKLPNDGEKDVHTEAKTKDNDELSLPVEESDEQVKKEEPMRVAQSEKENTDMKNSERSDERDDKDTELPNSSSDDKEIEEEEQEQEQEEQETDMKFEVETKGNDDKSDTSAIVEKKESDERTDNKMISELKIKEEDDTKEENGLMEENEKEAIQQLTEDEKAEIGSSDKHEAKNGDTQGEKSTAEARDSDDTPERSEKQHMKEETNGKIHLESSSAETQVDSDSTEPPKKVEKADPKADNKSKEESSSQKSQAIGSQGPDLNGRTEEKDAHVEDARSLDEVYRHYCDKFSVRPNTHFMKQLKDGGASTVCDNINNVVDFGKNLFGDRGILPVLEVLRLIPRMKVLLLPLNGLRNPGVQAISDRLKRHPGLTTLDLSGNAISIGASLALVNLIRENPALVEIDLRQTYIDAEYKDRVDRYLAQNKSKLLRSK